MNQQLSTFLKVPANSDFTIHNIPFGVVSTNEVFPATIIGDSVIRLDVFEKLGFLETQLFKQLHHQGKQVFQKNLDNFMSLSKPYWREVRQAIQDSFSVGSALENNTQVLESLLVDVSQVKYHLPCTIGEYTDFYSSKNHAWNIGSILRGPGNELQSNWVHLPVGYHGRRSTIVPTGTPMRRPWGQIKPPTAADPSFGICKRLDFELEIGAVLGGTSNELGVPVKVNEAEDRLFGLVLLNDWSARDLQAWEYIPLGPFTAKNLMTTISPWIVTPDALSPFTVELEKQDPQPFPYLREKNHTSYDLTLEVLIKTEKTLAPEKFVESNFKHLYWSIAQQITHHSITGCTMNPGDILGSGTISGKTRDSRGCLMEYTWNGKEPLSLSTGETRTFIEDGDSIEFRGYAGNGENRVGFGSCIGMVTPALNKDYFEN